IMAEVPLQLSHAIDRNGVLRDAVRGGTRHAPLLLDVPHGKMAESIGVDDLGYAILHDGSRLGAVRLKPRHRPGVAPMVVRHPVYFSAGGSDLHYGAEQVSACLSCRARIHRMEIRTLVVSRQAFGRIIDPYLVNGTAP